MRNLKKYLSVLLVVAMIATTMVPVFAAESYSYSAEAQKLNTLGLYAGISTTTFDPDLGTALDRETGVVMLLRIFGLEATAKAMSDADAAAALAAFTDAKDVSEWALKSVAYAVKNGLVAGTTETTIGPKAALSGDAYATLVLRQLGYTVGPNDFNNATYILADKGGLKITEAIKFDNKDLIKDDLVGITFSALSAKDTADVTVLASLMADGVVTVENAVYAGVYAAAPTATPTATPTPVPFGVENVTAVNAKQVEIKFTEELDKTSAEDEANFHITNNVGTAIFDGAGAVAALQADKMTVRLTVETGAILTQLKTNTVEVTTGVKNAAKVNLASAYNNTSILGTDLVAPYVENATMTGPKTIKITFSEPIDTAAVTGSDFKIDNGTVGVTSTITNIVEDRTITITAGTNLSIGKHIVEVNTNSSTNFKDFAGLPLIKAPTDLDVTSVTDAPTVTATSVKPNKVTLTFSRLVKNVGLATIYHGYSSNTGTISPVNLVNGYSDKWDINFPAGQYVPAGSINFYVKNSTTSGNEIKDYWGNKFADTTLSIECAPDTTAPEVASFTVSDRKTLKVVFNEDMNPTDAVDKSLYTFKTSTGTVMTASDFNNLTAYGHPNSLASITYDSSKYTSTITFSADFPTGDYQLVVKDIKDVAPYTNNKLVEVSKTFSVTNTNNPKLTSAVLTTNKLYLTFDKDMNTSGAGSVLAVENYQIDKDGTNGAYTTQSLPDGSTIALGATAKEVVITLGSIANMTSGGTATDTTIVAYVNDAMGKQIDAFNNRKQFTVASGVVAADIRKIKLIDKTTITFEVMKPLVSVNPALITLAGNGTAGNGIPVDSASFVNQTLSDGIYGAIVTLKTSGADNDKKLATSVAGGALDNQSSNVTQTDNITIAANGIETSLNIVNALINLPVATATYAASDKSAPYILATSTIDTDADGQINQILVQFSESLYAASVQETDFTVDGYAVDSVSSVVGGNVILNVDEKGVPDSSATPKVTLIAEVKDASADTNAVSSLDAVVSADTTAPIITAITVANKSTGTANTIENGDIITIYFSEAIKASTINAALTAGGSVTNVAAGSTGGVTGVAATGIITVANITTFDAGATLAGALTSTVDLALSADAKTLTITLNSVTNGGAVGGPALAAGTTVITTLTDNLTTGAYNLVVPAAEPVPTGSF